MAQERSGSEGCRPWWLSTRGRLRNAGHHLVDATQVEEDIRYIRHRHTPAWYSASALEGRPP